MKSYIQYLQGLYSAIFFGIAEDFPRLHRDCGRDSSRLLSLIESRGLPFLMIDLPDAGKHFDRCLSNEQLCAFGVAGFRPYRRHGCIPRLFKGLIQLVFDEDGVLRSVPDIRAIRYLRLLFYAAKKVKVACDDSRTWEHVHEFFETDSEVRLPSLNWDEDELRIDDLRHLDLRDARCSRPAPLLSLCLSGIESAEESLDHCGPDTIDAIQRTADIVSSTLGGFKPDEWRAKHGPGAVADQRRTQFKYDFPSWSAKLSTMFPVEDFGFANYSSWADWVRHRETRLGFSANEPPSKLIAVPKTLKGPRLIASEPVSHQWCQQMIKDFLVTRLRNTPISQSIHFRDQLFNQDAAKRASHTGTHATIDLSSASDRLSCWLVERIFRANSSLVSALHASRTRWISNSIDKRSPSFHKLRKFSCMGSACTFPIQSYVFTIISIGVLLSVRGIRPTIRSVRKASSEVLVFGDDIIVPTDCWEVLSGALSHLGLKVNHNKTYGIGKFRESCGVDAYDGHDVTPTYSMTYPEVSRPESIVSCVMTHNNFVLQGYLHVAQYVKSTVDKLNRFRFAYLPIGSGQLGWFSITGCDVSHLKSRWNTSLHRMEYLMDIAKASSRRFPTGSDQLLLQFFTEGQPRPEFIRPGERLGVAAGPKASIRRGWVALS